ncbi:hypothetical protein [Nonomuraea aridisoli]|uniref:Uncharacterized protein n=1 Tax=Nonomuraea aridisoli TaxID=2070368 RepID=A0A2W2E855_9ACTN|nr:hypothetical protein [Nonomuraea aridisoli]PZG20506.1 hypothetical protein C1J01_09180 [Nonomuraea aridisoli]
MSSFSCWAGVDVADGHSPEAFVAALRAASDEFLDGTPVRVAVVGRRVFVHADFAPHFTATIADLVAAWGNRAITAADFDEYGVVNEVLGPNGKAVHVASISEHEAPLPDGDTPRTRRAAAELFGVDPAVLDEVSATWAVDGAMPSCPGEPYLKWWEALGAPWPDDFGERSFDAQ